MRPWLADPHEGFIGRLARHQRDIELALFQERDVLVAALGVARRDDERRIGGVHDLGKGVAIERKAAARRRRAQADRDGRNGVPSLLRRSAVRQQQNAGANGRCHVPCVPPGSATRAARNIAA